MASEGSGSSSSGEEGSGSDEEQSGADLALVEGPGAEGAAEEVEDGEAGGEKPGAEEAGGEKAGDAVPEGWLPELRTADSFRVQRRLYPKSRRLFVDLGAEVLSRGDFYINPGVALSLAWFFDENWALELGASRYFPFLNPAASQVRESTGFVPNSRAPAWMFRGGARLSLGYGKIMLQGSVLHLEPQLFARLPVLLAEGSPGFGVELGGGALLHLAPQLHLRLDLAVFPHAERRDGWTFVLAVVPWLSMGMAFP